MVIGKGVPVTVEVCRIETRRQYANGIVVAAVNRISGMVHDGQHRIAKG
jgi:hypothetical protein